MKNSCSPLSDDLCQMLEKQAKQLQITIQPIVAQVNELSLDYPKLCNALKDIDICLPLSKISNSPALESLEKAHRLCVDMIDSTSLGSALSKCLTLPSDFLLAPIAQNMKSVLVNIDTGTPTDVFDSLADKLSRLSSDELWYLPDNDDTVELSPAVSDVLSETFPQTVIEASPVNGKFKLSREKAAFIMDLIVFVLTVIGLINSRAADAQNADYQQEMLNLERQKVEYLREISSWTPESDDSIKNVNSSNQECNK